MNYSPDMTYDPFIRGNRDTQNMCDHYASGNVDQLIYDKPDDDNYPYHSSYVGQADHNYTDVAGNTKNRLSKQHVTFSHGRGEEDGDRHIIGVAPHLQHRKGYGITPCQKQSPKKNHPNGRYSEGICGDVHIHDRYIESSERVTSSYPSQDRHILGKDNVHQSQHKHYTDAGLSVQGYGGQGGHDLGANGQGHQGTQYRTRGRMTGYHQQNSNAPDDNLAPTEPRYRPDHDFLGSRQADYLDLENCDHDQLRQPDCDNHRLGLYDRDGQDTQYTRDHHRTKVDQPNYDRPDYDNYPLRWRDENRDRQVIEVAPYSQHGKARDKSNGNDTHEYRKRRDPGFLRSQPAEYFDSEYDDRSRCRQKHKNDHRTRHYSKSPVDGRRRRQRHLAGYNETYDRGERKVGKSELLEYNSQLLRRVEGRDVEIARLQDYNSELLQLLEERDAEIARLYSKRANLKEKLKDLRNSSSHIQADLQQTISCLNSKLTVSDTEIAEYEQCVSLLHVELAKSRKDNETHETYKRYLFRLLAEKRSRIEELEEHVSYLQQKPGSNAQCLSCIGETNAQTVLALPTLAIPMCWQSPDGIMCYQDIPYQPAAKVASPSSPSRQIPPPPGFEQYSHLTPAAFSLLNIHTQKLQTVPASVDIPESHERTRAQRPGNTHTVYHSNKANDMSEYSVGQNDDLGEEETIIV